MSEQAHHLLRMSIRHHVCIRVIQDSIGFHAGQTGPFVLMEFAEMEPVVHIENATSSLFAERVDTTSSYRKILAELNKVALNEGLSREWIARLATQLGAPREEHDERP